MTQSVPGNVCVFVYGTLCMQMSELVRHPTNIATSSSSSSHNCKEFRALANCCNVIFCVAQSAEIVDTNKTTLNIHGEAASLHCYACNTRAADTAAAAAETMDRDEARAQCTLEAFDYFFVAFSVRKYTHTHATLDASAGSSVRLIWLASCSRARHVQITAV